MFRLPNQTKAVALLLAALGPAAAGAAPVMLRYDFTAVVTSAAYHHECHDFGDCADYEAEGRPTTYQGPALGSGGGGWLRVSFEGAAGGPAEFSYAFLGLAPVLLGQTVTAFDAGLRALTLEAFNGFDLFRLAVGPAGGTGYFGYEQDLSGVDFAEVEFRLSDVTVTDLTPPAPVPLPAALPLLAAAVAGLWLARRPRSAAGKRA